MTDCEVQAAPRSGLVAVGTSDVQMENCVFQNCANNGIEITGLSKATIVGSQFKGNTGVGALFTAKASTVRGCQFEENGKVGAQVVGSGAHITFQGCVFSGNLNAGASVHDGAKVKFSSCQVRANEKLGIILNNVKAVFNACEFSENKGVALDCKNGSLPSLDQCIFDGNVGFGCQISGKGTVVGFKNTRFQKNQPLASVIVYGKGVAGFTSCQFTESGQFHVEIREESQAKFEDCELAETEGGIGMFIHSDARVDIEKCMLRKEGKTALYAGMKSTVSILNSEIGNCAQCGLTFDAQSSGMVKDCKVKFNRLAGIQIQGGEVHIEGSEFEDHYFYGIAAKPGAVVRQEKNTFSDCKKGDFHVT
jgi:hypothetical protein